VLRTNQSPQLLRLLPLVLAVLTAIPALGQVPNPPPHGGPPGTILVDDMWIPPEAVFGEGTFNGTPWPNGTVYYVFDAGVTATQRSSFREALQEIRVCANLNFVESTGSGNYIYVRQNPNESNVSNSSVGMVGGAQNLNVGSNLWFIRFHLAHEVLHALGFLHEQSRPDRDNFVTIHWNCIEPGREGNFNKVNTATAYGPYDFTSVMHYRRDSFNVCPVTAPHDTITPLPGYSQFGNQMGQRNFLSIGDAQALAARYGAPSAPTISFLTPDEAQAGTGPVTITVQGGRYHEGSETPSNSAGVRGTRVLWDGQEVDTTYVNSTTVTFVATPQMLSGAGTHTVRVTNDAVAGGQSSGSRTFTVTCGSAGSGLGSSLADMGDMNGDGAPDYAVGEPGFSNDRGRVRIFSGRSGEVLYDWTGFVGNYFGTSIAALDDITGDGKKDLLVGCPGANNFAGRFMIFGSQSGATISDFTFSTASGQMGTDVAAVGDADGDGDVDFLVGSWIWGNAQGRVELWSTNGGLMRASVGGTTGDRFGYSMAGGRDVDGDGRPDYIIGTPHYDGSGTDRGRIRVFSGATGVILTTKEGDADYDYLGHSVALLDPTTSLVTSNDFFAAGAIDSGNISGNSGGTGYVRVWRGAATIGGYSEVDTYTGLASGDRYGHTVGSAGDINQDGYHDLFISATENGLGSQGPTGSGYVHFRSGRDGTVLHTAQRISFFGPVTPGLGFGSTVCFLGDIDQDARLDYVIGIPSSDSPCSNAGDIDIVSPPVPPALGRVLISEVSAGGVDGVELTNFGDTSVTTSGWTLEWKDNTVYTSTSISTTIAPGESILVVEPGGTITEAPPGTQILVRFPTLPTSTSDFAVALRVPTGAVIDEVHVAGSDGIYDEGPFHGQFRGIAVNQQTGQFVGSIGAERAWGLDSNGGSDWYSRIGRSFGLENTCSGDRGTDPLPLPTVRINEIDDSPDYIELYNTSSTQYVEARNWYFLASANQGLAHVLITPPPFIMTAQSYTVLGEGTTEPSEMPTAAVYVNVLSGGLGFPWGNEEYDCALYDNYGRLLDYVRTTGHDDFAAHNYPRAPSTHRDFVGAAQRVAGGTGAIGRNFFSTRTRTSDDWRPMNPRTMGMSNSAGAPFWFPDSDVELDVRLHSTVGGGGLTMIINGGPTNEGLKWSFLLSGGHLNGAGPLLGLGADAFANWLIFSTTPPWFGNLDSRGSARLDAPSGILPPGVAFDTIFLLQRPDGVATTLTKVLQYDS
jgi:hypothetical protein